MTLVDKSITFYTFMYLSPGDAARIRSSEKQPVTIESSKHL